MISMATLFRVSLSAISKKRSETGGGVLREELKIIGVGVSTIDQDRIGFRVELEFVGVDEVDVVPASGSRRKLRNVDG